MSKAELGARKTEVGVWTIVVLEGWRSLLEPEDLEDTGPATGLKVCGGARGTTD